MSRPHRLHAPGTMFHLMSRGNHRQMIFRAEKDYRKFRSLLKDYLDRYGVSLHGYCFMPNHVHLLCRVSERPVWEFMHDLLSSYAKWWNVKYEQVGHLTQGRYVDRIVDRDAYVLELIRYIHLNPVKAGLVDEVDAWEWSSWSAYTERPVPWVKTDLILAQFGDAVERLKAFVEAGMAPGYDLSLKVRKGRYVAKNDQLGVGVTKELNLLKVGTPTVDALKGWKPSISEEEFLDFVCRVERVSQDAVQGIARTRRLVLLRAGLARALQQWWGWNGVTIARLLAKTPATVSNLLKPDRSVTILISRWQALLSGPHN